MPNATTLHDPATPDGITCPSWCTTEHDDPTQHERELKAGRRQHQRGLHGFWLAEIRTGGEHPRVVRAKGPLVEVGLEQLESLDLGRAGCSTPQVEVTTYGTGGALSMTAPEARSLAAILVHGADVLEGLR